MATEFRGYTIVQPLGMGGMASIYLGVQENLKRNVAIKLLDKRLALNEDFVRRFEREARAASELNHRNIITIHEFGNEGSDYFIVMEYVKGSDLRAVLGQVSPFPPEVALVILEEVAAGLAAAHAKDIVHRDVKPANVLLSQGGDVKITDFGLARDYSLDASRLFDSLTVGGTVLGTPSYMSPEQASGLPLNDRTDTFSLGVMAYEMLSGQKPFGGETYSTIRDAVLQEDPPPLVLKRPLATPQIEDVVRRMVAKSPDQRPTMRQLVNALESCMETLDPSGTLLRYRRRFLEKFAADPVSFSNRLEELAVRKSLDRGLYAKALGLERLDVALEHLEFVKEKDPENSRAQRAIEEIAEFAGGSGAAPPESKKKEVGATIVDERPARRRSRRGPIAAIAVLGGLAAVLTTGWLRPDLVDTTRRRTTEILASVMSGSSEAATEGWLRVQTEPVGATVRLEDAGGNALRSGVAPASFGPVPAGSVLVVADLAGFDVSRRWIPLTAGDSASVAIALDPIQGRYRLQSDPSGSRVDVRAPGESAFRRLSGTTPLTTAELAPGRYEFRFRKNGFESVARAAEVTASGTDTLSVKLLAKAPPPAPAEVRAAAPRSKDAHVLVRTTPAGNVFLNGKLVEARTEKVVVRVPPNQAVNLEVRHPELFGARSWSRKVAAGDTLDLGTYEVATGTLRVSTRPHAPVQILIDGRETRKQTPLALTLASRRQVVSMQRAGWLIEKVVVVDRTGKTPPREIVPDDPGSFAGIPVDVVEGHDHKVVFHLTKAEG